MSEERLPLVRRAAQHMLTVLSEPDRWTQGANARDKSGSSVSPSSRHAERFCLIGASERARHDLGVRYGEWEPVERALQRAVGRRGGHPSIAGFNDSTTFPVVVEILREIAA